MKQPALQRLLLAAVLAAISGVVTLMVILAIMLSIGLFWQMAFIRNIPVLGEMAGVGIQDNFSRLPTFLWSWRYILVGSAIASIPLALLDRFGQRFDSPLRERFAPIGLLGVMGVVITTILLIQADQTLYVVDDVTGGLSTLADRQTAVWNQVLVAIPLAIGLGGASWLYWSWWYRHWRRWLGAGAPTGESEAGSSDAWLDRRSARARMLRISAIVLALGVALLIGATQFYGQVASTVRSGVLWASTDTPQSDATLQLSQPQRRLIVENTFGSGSANVSVKQSNGNEVVPPAPVTFAGARLGTQRTNLDIAGLPDGRYSLHAQLGEGQGGQIGYALIQGSSAAATTAAIAVGLAAGITLALAMLLISVYVQKVTGV